MTPRRVCLLDAAEAAVLEQVQVRLVTPEEEARWDQLMSQRHYLKSARMVGRTVALRGGVPKESGWPC
jgi:hypothetical protein